MSLLDDVLHPLRSRETRAAKSAASKAAVGPDDLSGFKGQNADAYDGDIREMSKKYAVPARLIKSIVSAESSFDPKITSPVGARGLMQLMPGTARELGVRDPTNPHENIEGACAQFGVAQTGARVFCWHGRVGGPYFGRGI